MPKHNLDCGSTLFNTGGHTLAPLLVDTLAQTVTLNNAYPASFFDVPNQPSSNPQTVCLQYLPEGWTLAGLNLPSQDYSEVVVPVLGSDADGYAILWTANMWTISAHALLDAPGYTPLRRKQG